MKKILVLIISILYIIQLESAKAAQLCIRATNFSLQISNQDTLQYLKDSIEIRKQAYIGKPLSSLLKDLKLNVVEFFDGFNPGSMADSLHTSAVLLYFSKGSHDLENILKKARNENLHFPCIIITFQKPVALKSSLMASDNDFGLGRWSLLTSSFFGPHIISDIKVVEY